MDSLIDLIWYASPSSPWLSALRQAPNFRIAVETLRGDTPPLKAGAVYVRESGDLAPELDASPATGPPACLILLGPGSACEDHAAASAELYLPTDVPAPIPELAAVLVRSAVQRSKGRASQKIGPLEDYFLASMSHELRTPLNNVIGIVDSLHEGVVGPTTVQQQRFLGLAKESAGHLLEIINNILDLSKIESGAMHVDIHAIDVSELITSAERLVFDAAFKKGLSISLGVSPEMPKIYGDERLLKQVLVNLLSNAVKFTPPNGEIGLNTFPHPDGRTLCLEVWDSGIGIEPEALERVFEPFVQLDSGIGRAHEGTGLGLSLVRRLVELHGGTVTVKSQGQSQGGATFSITLPSDLTPTSAGDGPDLPSPTDAITMDGLVLVVDDDELSRKIVAAYIESHGFGVVEAGSGEEAVDVFHRIQPDVILMDLALPGISGLEAIKQIRDTEVDTRVAIVTLTARTRDGTREQCIEAGADLYFSKPARYRELVLELRALLELSAPEDGSPSM